MHVGHKHFLSHVNISAATRATRKKPVNPEEIAPVKGRFAEDEQQENRRRQPPNGQNTSLQGADEGDAVAAARAFGGTRPPSSGAVAAPVQMATAATAASQMASSLDALLAGIKSEATTPGIETVLPVHHATKAKVSLDDLLALMRAAPQKP